MLNWFVESRTWFLSLIFLVKTADVSSTLLLADQYSWEAEAGYTMIGYLDPFLGHRELALATIPTAIVVGYIGYVYTPAGAEFAILYFSWITVGNFGQLWLPVIGSLWNAAGLPVLLSAIIGRGLDPIWFDRSPVRDELLESIEEAKSWTRRVRGEIGAV